MDIGGGGKRKPPTMHHVRRLREPGKIHQRRRNCFCKAVPFLCVFPVEFLRLPSDASHVRGGCRAGNLFAAAIRGDPFSPWQQYYTKKFRPAAEMSQQRVSPRFVIIMCTRVEKEDFSRRARSSNTVHRGKLGACATCQGSRNSEPTGSDLIATVGFQ